MILSALLLLILALGVPAHAALLFDGVDDYVITGGVAGAPTAYPFTVVAVAKFAVGSTGGVFIQFGRDDTNTGFQIYRSDAGDVLAAYRHAGPDVISASVIPEGVWVFVAWSSASATSHRLYCFNYETLSECFNDTSTTNLGTLGTPTNSITIGAYNTNGVSFSNYFPGTMQWLAVYNVNFTLAGGNAFQAMRYLGPYAVATPTLLYTFNEMAGIVVLDRRRTGSAGTLTNFPGAPWQAISLPGPVAP